MGLEQNSNKIYLSVADGKIIQRVQEGTEGAISRTTKEGKIVYELKHSAISGIISGIAVVEKEFAGKKLKQWNIDIDDVGLTYQLQLQYSSGYSTSFLKALANPILNFSSPIRIAPWMKVVNDKKKTSIYVQQNSEDIPWFFTKDNPNGLPEMKQVVVKGEKVWDDYDMMQFLEAYIKSKIVPQLSKGRVHTSNNAPGYVPDYANAPEPNDLPF